jgi:hypothetical protein
MEDILRCMERCAVHHRHREQKGGNPLCAANPGGPWMEQMARNLVDAVDGFLVGKRYILIDRDPLHTEAFRRWLADWHPSPTGIHLC